MKKVYELVFSNESKGCFRVSLVKDPAVESTLVKFSKEQEQKFFFFNDEKRIIYSVAMRPNKLIHRNNVNGEPADVFYTEQTIESLQQNYFKQQGNSGTNVNHEDNNTPGIFPFESWIVKDPASDKSTLMGLETQKGDWVMAFKIENDQVWEDCKNGNLDGLSIEAYLGHKQTSINFNKEPMKIKDMILLFIKQTMSAEADKKELAPGMFGTSLEPGSAIVDKDGNSVVGASFKVGDAEYETDDMGLIKPAKTAMADGEMTPEEMKQKIADLTAEVESLKGDKATAEADKTKAETELETMRTEKEGLETTVTTMKTEAETLNTKLVTMAGQTAAALSIKNVPTVETVVEKKYEEMDNRERMQFNRQK